MEEFQIVPLYQVIESTTNPRQNFRSMEELTASVKANGVLVPLLVRPLNRNATEPAKLPKYEIVAGARRYRAAKAAGHAILPVRIMNLGDTEALELQVIENLQREDVHPLEEAIGYKTLLERPGYDVAAIAAKVGKSESYVYQRLKLSDLIKPAQHAFLEDRITAGHAILIAKLQSKDQAEALNQCFRSNYVVDNKRGPAAVSVHELSGWIQRCIHLDLNGSPFDKRDADLVPSAGPCTTCSKRTGFMPQLFPDIAKKDTCTDRTCYESKLQAFISRKEAELKAKGERVARASSSDHWNLRSDEEKKLLPSDKYTRLSRKDDRCENTQKAIIAHGWEDVGRVIDICADPKCKVHCRHDGYRLDPKEQAKRRAEEEKRRSELKYRQTLLSEVLARVPATLQREDWETIARTLASISENETAKAILKRHGWEPGKASWGGNDTREGIARQIPKLTGQELFVLLIEMSLAPDLSFVSVSYSYGPERLLETAERYGVNAPAIRKMIDQEITAKKKLKQTKAKASKAAARESLEGKITKSKKPEVLSAKKKPDRRQNKDAQPHAWVDPDVNPGHSADDEHKCEVCRCTESRACEGGCAWNPAYLSQGRYVCTRCSDQVVVERLA